MADTMNRSVRVAVLWNLHKLKLDATEACRAAFSARQHARKMGNVDPFENDPINWGDLRCIEAQSIRSSDVPGYSLRVLIEEASPDCNAFRRFVAEELARKGWPPYVEVSTEW